MDQYQPRRDQPPAVPPEFLRQQRREDPWAGSAPPSGPQFRPAAQPQPQQYPPPVYRSGYSGQPYDQGYWQQPPVQVNVVQQNGRGPVVVARPGLGAGWTIFHLFMTFATCGLWIPVWIIHHSSRRPAVYR